MRTGQVDLSPFVRAVDGEEMRTGQIDLSPFLQAADGEEVRGQRRLCPLRIIDMELTKIKGVGPKTASLFEKLGIRSCEDLLLTYPVHYDAYEPPVPCGAASLGAKCAVSGLITQPPAIRPGGRVSVTVADISDPTGKIRLIWYNAPFIRNVLKKGCVYIFRGTVSIHRGVKTLEHPEIFKPSDYEQKIKTLHPVYALTKGLTNNAFMKAVAGAMDLVPLPSEYLPEQMVRSLALMDETEAARAMHLPENEDHFAKARARVVFDEFFLFILAMRTLRAREAEAECAFPMKAVWETESILEKLPFRLTSAQMRVWTEIEQDLASDRLMSRLVQGDVGSGKTILAFLAMAQTAANGYQSSLMAPTEVLARQHFEKLCAFVEEQNLTYIKPVLLIGAQRAAERRESLTRIASGEANCIIGTHALIQEGVAYKSLALVITDEQHRFGVFQRRAMAEKGEMPNIMVMSATPIPRTLGVIYYGDLDISVIDQLPAHRLPIKNAVVDVNWRPNAWRFLAKEVAAGHQCYVICPMIEPSEELEAENVLEYSVKLSKELPDARIGLLHGRMKAEEKNEVMARMGAGEIDILVSTTVVEVGVDVPNATVMLIENAERFGLAQLHQLRGRVGRGDAQSYCIFLAGQASEAITKRLDILKHSNNGFEIAEKDFELRGPGDLLGIRQSGEAAFRIADLSRDREILKKAGDMAAVIMADDPALIGEEYELLKKRLDKYLTTETEGITL